MVVGALRDHHPLDARAAYPTFCCPGDDTCRAHIHNVQVGYADGTIEELAATVAAACDELKRAPLPACSVNETAATYA